MNMAIHPLRIGIVGAGFGGSVLAPAFGGAEHSVVQAIASAHPEHARDVQREQNIPQVFDHWEDLIASPDIDAVAIAVPPPMHAPIVEAALRTRKHVFCEKPLAMTVAEAERMLRAARESGVVHMVNFEFRFLPVLRELKRLLPTMPAIDRVECSWDIGSWADPNRPWTWQSDKRQGGGVLSSYGVHMLDLAEWLFGPALRLSAATGITVAERMDADGVRRPVTSEDHASVELCLQAGFSVFCKFSNVSHVPTGQWVTIHAGDTILRAGGDAGAHFVTGYRLTQKRHGQPMQELPVSSPADIARESDGRIALVRPAARHFADRIRGVSTDSEPSFVAGVRAQRLLEAVETSAERGIAVDIPMD